MLENLKINTYEKVVCVKIDSRYKHHLKLKIGKTYLAHIQKNSLFISDNGENIGYYHPSLFTTVSEWRDMVIKNIGI